MNFTAFSDFDLYPSLSKSLNEQGYTTPTPIQLQAIPIALQGRDLLGCAQTGTGKTAAFVLPILQQMLADKNQTPQRRIKALILAPTRELALQIAETVSVLAKYTQVRCAAIFGGVPQNPQVNKIRQGVDILIATPGRLKDLMQQGYISLQHIQYLVLDEADRMLDLGFAQDVKRIIAQLPAKRQTLLFSATMPASILSLANSLLHQPARVEITPVSTAAERVEQFVYFTDKSQKPGLLVNLLQTKEIETVIVFTQMKHTADKVSKYLKQSGINAEAIHGNKSQKQREFALQQFKSRNLRVLVATDIAARGIDVDKLSHVINYDLTQTAETYVHRIGRTGRAGSAGTAISICTPDERPLLNDIQKLIKKTIPVLQSPLQPAGFPSQQKLAVGNTPMPSFRRHPRPIEKRSPQRELFNSGSRQR